MLVVKKNFLNTSKHLIGNLKDNLLYRMDVPDDGCNRVFTLNNEAGYIIP